MSFGKRGDESASTPQSVRKVPLVAPPVKKSSGNFDRGFAALALGVVIISAGGAMAAPTVVSWVGSTISGSGSARPIATVVAGLNKDQAREVLAREAFPDQEGRAFMASLSSKFPDDHARLLDDLAASALVGGDRDDLMTVVGNWMTDFMRRNMPAIGRTGASGFDQILSIASDGLSMLEAAGNGNCNLETLQKLANNPAQIADLGSYGSPGYKLSMRASRMMVDLAAEGRNAGPAARALLPKDEQVLQSAFFSMLQDPQIMSLMQASMPARGSMPGASQQAMTNAAISKVNVCKLGRTVIVKLKNLPSDTKSRLWGVAMLQAKIPV